jgi:hypothetical protein
MKITVIKNNGNGNKTAIIVPSEVSSIAFNAWRKKNKDYFNEVKKRVFETGQPETITLN